jgi:hypothetical protein
MELLSMKQEAIVLFSRRLFGPDAYVLVADFLPGQISGQGTVERPAGVG